MSITSILKKPVDISSALVAKKVRFTDETNKEEDQLCRPSTRYQRGTYHYSPGKYASHDAIPGDGRDDELKKFPCVIAGRYHKKWSARQRCPHCNSKKTLKTVAMPLEPISGELPSYRPPLLQQGLEILPSTVYSLEPMEGNLPSCWPPQPPDPDHLTLSAPTLPPPQLPSPPSHRPPLLQQGLEILPSTVYSPEPSFRPPLLQDGLEILPLTVYSPEPMVGNVPSSRQPQPSEPDHLTLSAPTLPPPQLPSPPTNSLAPSMSEPSPTMTCSCIVTTCVKVFHSERKMMRHVIRDHPLPDTDDGFRDFMDSL